MLGAAVQPSVQALALPSFGIGAGAVAREKQCEWMQGRAGLAADERTTCRESFRSPLYASS